MENAFVEAVESSAIIAAVKHESQLPHVLETDCMVVFLLCGTICSISDLVLQVKNAGKMAIVHLDLINGLASKEVAVDFIKQYTRADGIITTKPQLIKKAKELGLYTVLRFFVIDSKAFESIEKQIGNTRPDFIEVLPALMPKMITKICDMAKVPVITGGLISDKEDVMSMLDAGAVAVSSTNEGVWFL